MDVVTSTNPYLDSSRVPWPVRRFVRVDRIFERESSKSPLIECELTTSDARLSFATSSISNLWQESACSYAPRERDEEARRDERPVARALAAKGRRENVAAVEERALRKRRRCRGARTRR